jgi:hypothetical protein
MTETALDGYFAAHNDGVRTGDFSALGPLFAEDAILSFHGLPFEPVHRREQIVQAFTEHPPDDELVLVETCTDDTGHQIASYRWKNSTGDASGSLCALIRDDLIEHLEVHVTLELQL